MPDFRLIFGRSSPIFTPWRVAESHFLTAIFPLINQGVTGESHSVPYQNISILPDFGTNETRLGLERDSLDDCNPLINKDISRFPGVGSGESPKPFSKLPPASPITGRFFRNRAGLGREGGTNQKAKPEGVNLTDKPMSEEREQCEVVAWFKRAYGPELAEHLHHSPNGGHRNKATARRFKYLGVRRGFPDLVLYLPRSLAVVGCAIELKPTDSGNDCSDFQKDWLRRLAACSFEVHGPVDGMQAAKRILREYMDRAGHCAAEGVE